MAGLELSPLREHEIVEELSQHLEDEYDNLLRGAVTEPEAYAAALVTWTKVASASIANNVLVCWRSWLGLSNVSKNVAAFSASTLRSNLARVE